MIGTKILSIVSDEDCEYAKKKIFWQSPTIWVNIIIFALFAAISLFYLILAVYPLFSGGKVYYYRLILAAVLAVIYGVSLTRIIRILKKRSETKFTDITFEENHISGSFSKGKSRYSYTSMEHLYIFPKTVVITGSGGGIYIARTDIPDLDEMKRFLLEKNPHLKEKHMN